MGRVHPYCIPERENQSVSVLRDVEIFNYLPRRDSTKPSLSFSALLVLSVVFPQFVFDLQCLSVDIKRLNNVVSTLMRRDDVASTLIRRCFGGTCLQRAS